MNKWLKKIQEMPALQADKTDTIKKLLRKRTDCTDTKGNVSVMSVPTLSVFAKNDALDYFNEGAAIMEFDGELHQEEAEHKAYLYTLEEFNSRNCSAIHDCCKINLER